MSEVQATLVVTDNIKIRASEGEDEKISLGFFLPNGITFAVDYDDFHNQIDKAVGDIPSKPASVDPYDR